MANSFSFTSASVEEVKRPIECLVPKKDPQENDIRTKTLKQNSDSFAFAVQKGINASIFALKFSNDLKEADIIPVHKKKLKLSKENYSSVSIPPNICLYGEISKCFGSRFSKNQCGFHKGSVGNRGVFTALLSDYSNVFDCIAHDLIIAKAFCTNPFKRTYSYLSKRKQKNESQQSIQCVERYTLCCSARLHT